MQPKEIRIVLSTDGKWTTARKLATELGVTPSRLANWRTRYEDFPKTVKSESGVILYDAEAVALWKENQFPERDGGSAYGKALDSIRKFSEILRDSLDIEEFAPVALGLLCLVKLGLNPEKFFNKSTDEIELGDPIREVLESVFQRSRVSEVSIQRLNDFLKEIESSEVLSLLGLLDTTTPKLRGRWGYPTSPDSLNKLISKLITSKKSQIFDPAVGEGRTLFEAVKETEGRAFGQDVNEKMIQIAKMRAFLLGVTAELEVRNSFDRPLLDSPYQVIVADPPMGMKYPTDAPAFSGPFGTSRLVADWAWIQIVAMNLAERGEGYINVTSGALFHRFSTDIRREMIRRGCIEAVISLPPLSSSSRVSTSLICLRAPDVRVGESVLMLDASDVPSRDTVEFDSMIPKLVQIVKDFRKNPESVLAHENATVVSVLDLLEGDCSLAPAQRIAKSRKSRRTDVGQLAPLLNSVDSAVKRIREFKLGEFDGSKMSVSHKPLRDLRLNEVATLIQGVRTEAEVIRRDQADQKLPKGSQSVLTVRALRKPGPLLSGDFIEFHESSKAITEPGDIVIARMGDSLAKVDAVGGNLVLAPLGIIRVTPALDPYIVAASLNSNHVRKMAMSSSGVGRIDLDAVEIPAISGKDAQNLRAAIRSLENLESDIETLKESLIFCKDQMGDFLATADEVIL